MVTDRDRAIEVVAACSCAKLHSQPMLTRNPVRPTCESCKERAAEAVDALIAEGFINERRDEGDE